MNNEVYVIWNKFDNKVIAIVEAIGEKEIFVLKGKLVFKKNERYTLKEKVGATSINKLFTYMNDYDDIDPATCTKKVWEGK